MVDVVSVLYYTDPSCPRSWAAEPARRRLQREFGESVPITYVMGGLGREFDRPLDCLRGWLEAAAASSMPIDPRLWLDAPPKGSYPACLAVHAAAEQGLADAYLRRAREALAFERRRLDHGDALVEIAREITTMNVERFASDLASHAILEAFGADLERTRAVGDGALPRLEFWKGGATVGELRGGSVIDGEAWSATAAAAGAAVQSAPTLGVEQALRTHGRLATPEVAAACGLPGPRAQAELWRLAGEWRVRAERHLSGETWTLG